MSEITQSGHEQWVIPDRRQQLNILTSYLLFVTFAVGTGYGITHAADTDQSAITCPEVPPDVVVQTTDLLDNPDKIDAFRPDNGKFFVHGDDEWTLRKTTAEKLGLTMNVFADEHPDAYERLRWYPYQDRWSLSKHIGLAAEFADKYGITLSAPSDTSAIPSADAVKPLHFEKMNADTKANVRHAIMGIMDSLSAMPEEFVRKYGAKNIYLAQINDEKVAAFAESGENIYIDPTGWLEEDTLVHEMTHIWDWNICGGNSMDRDPGFEALNPTDIYDPKIADLQQGGFASDESVQASLQARKLSRLLRTGQQDDASRDKTEKAYNSLLKDIVVTDNYGFTNPVEDKATLGNVIFNPTRYSKWHNTAKPVVDSKFTYLLARLYEHDPTLAEYFIAVGSHK